MKGQVKILTITLILGIVITLVFTIYNFGYDYIETAILGTEEEGVQERPEDTTSLMIYNNTSNENIKFGLFNSGSNTVSIDDINIYFNGQIKETEEDCDQIEPSEICNIEFESDESDGELIVTHTYTEVSETL